MNIFVTGASGFIGGAIAKELAKKHTIYGMARSEKSAAKIEALGAKAVRSTLGAVKQEHLQECEVVIHCAAFVAAWGSREDFWRANVEGTSQLLEVAKAAGIKRFIFLSSESALFRGQTLLNIDESYPYPEKTPFLYSETKAEAERRVLAANDKDKGFFTIALRPRLVWGPGDQTVLAEVTKMVEAKKFAWFDQGRAKTSTTYIHNLVHATELCLEKGHGGEAYFISDGEDLHFKDFLTAYLGTQGVSLPDSSIPSGLAKGIAQVLEGIWKAFKIKGEPPLNSYVIAAMSTDITLNIAKAEKDLAYKPLVSFQEAIVEMTSV